MRRRTRVGFGVGLALAALLVWGVWPRGIPDPVVRGKPLSAWLGEQRRLPDGQVVLTVEASEAVRALGGEAPSALRAILGQSDPALRRGAVLVGRVLRLRSEGTAIEVSRRRAVLGVRALGSAARPAWPGLVAIALQPVDDFQFRDAVDALSGADVATARLLADGTRSADRSVRLRAVLALQVLHIAPDEVTLPALESLRGDPDPNIRAQVAVALPDLLAALPKYATLLRSSDPRRRAAFARLIGGFRSRARPYLPDLQALVDDPDPAVRRAVADAIRQTEGPTAPPPQGPTPPDAALTLGKVEPDATSAGQPARP